MKPIHCAAPDEALTVATSAQQPRRLFVWTSSTGWHKLYLAGRLRAQGAHLPTLTRIFRNRTKIRRRLRNLPMS